MKTFFQYLISSLFLISASFLLQPLPLLANRILKSAYIRRISSFTATIRNSHCSQLNANIRFTTASAVASKSSSGTALGMSGIDIPLVPAIIGAAVAVFAVFNIENPVDLTDRGRAEARAKRRAERIAKGETFNPKDKAGSDLAGLQLFHSLNFYK